MFKFLETGLLLVLILLINTFSANAVPTSCTNTWFRKGVKSRLDINWNTPLPVISENTVEMPAPAPELSSSPIVHLSETEILDSFFGIIEITITGINPGQRIILEKYRVDDPEIGVDENSLLMASYIIQEGYTPIIGETHNFNVPYDFSEAEGEIVAQLDFYEPSPASIVGNYVYRVRSPNHAFDPIDVPFLVRAEEWDQLIEGLVTSDDQPVPHAFVVLLDPLGLDNDFVKGTIADENGHFSLYTDRGEFDLVTLKPGYVSLYGKDVSLRIFEGETWDVEIPLIPGDRTISGILSDAENPEITLPGVEVLLFSLNENNEIDTNLCTICWTDQEGKFSAKVISGIWGVVPRLQAVYDRGYISPGLELAAVVDAREGDSDGHVISLSKGKSIIWGTLTSLWLGDEWDPQPLDGVEVRGIRSEDGAAAHAVTDGEGRYRLAVGPGHWNVFAVSSALYNVGHTSPSPSDLKVPEGHASLQYDFQARPLDAWIWGFAEDHNGDPIGKLELRAVNFASELDELPYQSTYETNGFYLIPLAYGDWKITPDPVEAARRQLIFAGLPQIEIEELFFEEEPADIRVDLSTIASTGTLSLIFKSEDGEPIPDIRVHGMSTGGDGPEYHSFGLSDASGVAKIAVIEGRWMFHPSDTNLREKGFNEVYTFELDIQTGEQEHTLFPERKQGTYPKLSFNQDPDLLFPQFKGEGESGQRFIIEASSGLDDWREFGRVISEEGSFRINAVTVPFLEQMFVRARPE